MTLSVRCVNMERQILSRLDKNESKKAMTNH